VIIRLESLDAKASDPIFVYVNTHIINTINHYV
jgi:hypothetical protein